MRTFAVLFLIAFAITPRIVCAAGGHIEVRKHRFSKHSDQKFERLVVEFKQEGGRGMPNVRVGTDGAAGEVSIQVSEVTLKGAIPEAGINDSFVPKSKLLGPISVSADSTRGGFTLRTFLKAPQTKIDAFWLENPSRLVVDAFAGNAPRASGLKATGRGVAGSSRRAKNKRSNKDYLCFPSQSAVGLKVTFQSKVGKGKMEGIPVPLDGGARTSGEGESVVCYPKKSQVIAGILFDSPTVAPPHTDLNADAQGESEAPSQRSIPIPATAPRTSLKSPSTQGAPANSIHNKSPQSEEFEAPMPLSLPSAETKPATAPAPAAKDLGLPSLGLSLPSKPAGGLEAGRMPTASTGKPSLNLPLSLPTLPQAAGSGPQPTKLSLPPPQQTSQAPALLPPISK